MKNFFDCKLHSMLLYHFANKSETNSKEYYLSNQRNFVPETAHLVDLSSFCFFKAVFPLWNVNFYAEGLFWDWRYSECVFQFNLIFWMVS